MNNQAEYDPLEDDARQPTRIVNGIFDKQLKLRLPEVADIPIGHQKLVKLGIGIGVLAVIKALDKFPEEQFTIPALLDFLERSLKEGETSQPVDVEQTPS